MNRMRYGRAMAKVLSLGAGGMPGGMVARVLGQAGAAVVDRDGRWPRMVSV